MTRGRTFLNTCLHAVNKHSSFTGSSPLHAYNMNVSRFSWNYFQTASSFYEPKNHQAKNITPHHTGVANAIVFYSSSHEILRCSNNFSKRPSTRSLNSSWLMKKALYLQHGFLPLGAHFSSSSYSLDASGKKNGLQNATPTDYAKETTNMTTNSIGNEWSDILDGAHQSLASAVSYIGKMVKEVSNEVTPCVQQLYYSHPYMEKVIIPVGGTISATLLAWFIMPRILRKFHKYATRNPLAIFSGDSIEEQIPYEKTLWGALEDPARYLITFLSFYELSIMVAPTTSQIFPQAWRGAVVLSLVWFLHRWKTNVFTRIMEKPASVALEKAASVALDREKLLTLEKISTIGLLVLGAIALAEACGVAVQSILTVGGIGGVATAFAAKDILGNILSGLSLQFSRPFSLGDNIKAGSIEGQVVEMGLTTTYLMNPEKFPVIVPNSLFSSQVIVNKSRAQLRACMKKIPICIDDLGKVPHVTEEIKSMLHSDTRVSLEKDAPYCFLSRIENSFLELTLGCNLINMKKDEIYAAEQNILLQAAAIIKRHGAKIGCSVDDVNRI